MGPSFNIESRVDADVHRILLGHGLEGGGRSKGGGGSSPTAPLSPKASRTSSFKAIVLTMLVIAATLVFLKYYYVAGTVLDVSGLRSFLMKRSFAASQAGKAAIERIILWFRALSPASLASFVYNYAKAGVASTFNALKSMVSWRPSFWTTGRWQQHQPAVAIPQVPPVPPVNAAPQVSQNIVAGEVLINSNPQWKAKYEQFMQQEQQRYASSSPSVSWEQYINGRKNTFFQTLLVNGLSDRCFSSWAQMGTSFVPANQQQWGIWTAFKSTIGSILISKALEIGTVIVINGVIMSAKNLVEMGATNPDDKERLLRNEYMPPNPAEQLQHMERALAAQDAMQDAQSQQNQKSPTRNAGAQITLTPNQMRQLMQDHAMIAAALAQLQKSNTRKRPSPKDTKRKRRHVA
jgi:hypothetical protein